MSKRDCIRITNLKVHANHGVFAEEKRDGQDFYVNAVLYMDLHTPGITDGLDDAVDYGAVCQAITRMLQEKTYDLIEAACENLCRGILLEFDKVDEVEIEVQKPHAPIGLPFENVSVQMSRKWHQVYLSVGSNMGDSVSLIRNGVERLSAHGLIRNVKCSELIVTKPYGPVEQDDFINGCIYLETLLGQEELLEVLHVLEADADRRRVLRWGPRTLDLDIVFYDKLVYESKTLIIPHVDMENRYFVLKPLAELCPNFRHPILGKTVTQLLNSLENEV